MYYSNNFEGKSSNFHSPVRLPSAGQVGVRMAEAREPVNIKTDCLEHLDGSKTD